MQFDHEKLEVYRASIRFVFVVMQLVLKLTGHLQIFGTKGQVQEEESEYGADYDDEHEHEHEKAV